MATILQHDKRSGLTYAYESVSYWDKEEQQSRARRTLLGRVNPESGEIEPTDGRGRRCGVQKIKSSQLTPLPSRRFYGATYLLDEIGRNVSVQPGASVNRT